MLLPGAGAYAANWTLSVVVWDSLHYSTQNADTQKPVIEVHNFWQPAVLDSFCCTVLLLTSWTPAAAAAALPAQYRALSSEFLPCSILVSYLHL